MVAVAVAAWGHRVTIVSPMNNQCKNQDQDHNTDRYKHSNYAGMFKKLSGHCNKAGKVYPIVCPREEEEVVIAHCVHKMVVPRILR